MGWGRTLLLGDIGNRLDIEDTEREIAKLSRDIFQSSLRDMSQDQKIDAVLKENAELKLYLAALIRLLTVKGTLSREELKAMVDAVDAEDGSSDGKYEGSVV
ncbi:MAG: hypothetical protein ACI8PB_002613 [Desulforhopalus sp.]|jgi:hypothetical protein